MSSESNSWVVFTVLGTLALVVGLALLGGQAWYVQYPVLLAAVALSAVGVRRAVAESQST